MQYRQPCFFADFLSANLLFIWAKLAKNAYFLVKNGPLTANSVFADQNDGMYRPRVTIHV